MANRGAISLWSQSNSSKVSASFACGIGSFGRRPDERGKGKHIVLTPVPNWHLDKHGGNMGVAATPATVFHSCVWLTHITPDPCPWVLTHSVSLYLVFEQKHVSTHTHTNRTLLSHQVIHILFFFLFTVGVKLKTHMWHTYRHNRHKCVRPSAVLCYRCVCVSCLRTRQRQRHRHR